MTDASTRFWEIDLIRGLALIGMLLYHAIFDLNFTGICQLPVVTGIPRALALITASTFIALVGISLSLKKWRYIALGRALVFREYLMRGVTIFLIGFIITLVTWIYPGRGFVCFGVLHLIGLSIILAYPFLKHQTSSLVIGCMVVLTGIWFDGITWPNYCYIWAGLVPKGFYTLDYFPLFPWFGIVLLGTVIGNVLYSGYVRAPFLRSIISKFNGGSRINSVLTNLGRHTLMIYLIHQPLLLGTIFAFKKMVFELKL